MIKNLKKLRMNKNHKIIGYGSPAKATTALNFFGISSNDIDFIVEDNKLKHGKKFIPGVRHTYKIIKIILIDKNNHNVSA